MAIKVYGVAVSGNVNPITALCVENDIPYELKHASPMDGTNKTPEFLKMNPMHSIPTIDDDGFTMYVFM